MNDCCFRCRDGLSLYYREWPGPPEGDGLPVLCVPGLTRNHRDFDELAERLARTRRVLCADLRGRGRSDRDPDPTRYTPATYLEDLVELLDQARAPRVDVVGTSLGGLLAMMLAATRPDRVGRIVLNDIGPEVDPTGLARIRGYVGKTDPADTWEEAVAAARTRYGSELPDLGDEDWLRYARKSFARGPDGRLVPDYDPAIAQPTEAQRAGSTDAAAAPGPSDLWPLWARLREVPVLVLRGETSDILSPAILERMTREKPDLVRVTVPRRGHAPLLDEPESLAALDGFLG